MGGLSGTGTNAEINIPKNEAVTIVFSVDANMAASLCVLLRSVLDTISHEKQYEIVVLHNNMPLGAQEMIKRSVIDGENVSLRLLEVGGMLDKSDFYVANRKSITGEAYFRLFIPWLMPECKKCIYLDADMIVLEDLAVLYDTDVSGVMIASSRDLTGIGIAYGDDKERADYYKNKLGIAVFDDMIISGMLVMNLERFRSELTFDKMLELVRSKSWFFHDQDILNVLCRDSTKLISSRWDVLPKHYTFDLLPDHLKADACEGFENPCIIHFGGSYSKPWQVLSHYAIRYFWPVALRTEPECFRYVYGALLSTECTYNWEKYKNDLFHKVIRRLPISRRRYLKEMENLFELEKSDRSFRLLQLMIHFSRHSAVLGEGVHFGNE